GTSFSAWCDRTFQLAVFTACQIPDKSGLPSAVRGNAWPATGVANAAMASIETTIPIRRIRIQATRTLGIVGTPAHAVKAKGVTISPRCNEEAPDATWAHERADGGSPLARGNARLDAGA